MKLSQDIINILKNFSVINNSIVIDELDHIRTISESGNIIGVYKPVDFEFPMEFAIWDLSEFLSIVSLFKLDEIEFNFKKKYIEIVHNTNKIKYVYTDKSKIKKFDELKATEVYRDFDKFTCNFHLSEEDIKKIRKASTIMQLDTLSIDIGEENSLTLICDDEYNKNTFNMSIEDFQGVGDIKVNVEYLEMIPNDYDISIFPKKCMKFNNTDSELFYMITANIT